MHKAPLIAAIVAALALGGCSNKGLKVLPKPGKGPDEFSILPTKPLQQPSNFTELPQPTPGGGNLTDQDPLGDGIRALGGRPNTSDAIPGSDRALVANASRFGRDDSIRATTASEDEAYRQRRGRLTRVRITRNGAYEDVYRPQALNPTAEARRWRRAGAATPSAPPN